MNTIQTRINNLEKQVNSISGKNISYIFCSKVDSNGSILYQVDRGSGYQWITKSEFNKFIEKNYPDKSIPFLIIDTPELVKFFQKK